MESIPILEIKLTANRRLAASVETSLYADSYGNVIFRNDGFFLYNNGTNDTAEQVIEWLAEYWEIGE